MKLKSLCAVALAVVFGLTGCENDDPVAVERLSLDKTAMTLTRGESGMLVATIEPENAEDKSVVWSSSDESVATVDAGHVTAVAVGRATITARAATFTATCEVTVEGIPVTKVELDVTSCSLDPGQSVVLTATVLPDDADDRTVAWSSSDESVATVDAEGTVTAVAPGEAQVKAAAGEAEAICTVTVKAPAAAVQVGDYYYSDGSFSSTLDASKTVVGVVFYDKDPSVHDAALRREHPECTHGLVIALTETTNSWQYNRADVGPWIEENVTDYVTVRTEYEGEEPDYLNKIMGYNNTKAIELYNAAEEHAECQVEAIHDVVAYRVAVPAPAGTSDWYLPSLKELSLLTIGEYDGNVWHATNLPYSVLEQIDGKMRTIPGAQEFSDMFYWSSTEHTRGRAYSSYWGYLAYSNKFTKVYLIRCVLAF